MKKYALLTLLTSFYILNVSAQTTDFITKWNLATGGSGPTQLSFGVATSGTVSYTWQEVSPGTASGSGTFSGSPLTITGLPANSVIRLSISPTNFQRIIINNGTDRNRLVDVEQWGSISWTSMERAFLGCNNLNITSTDVPNLSGVTNMSLMFATCTSLTGPANIGTWNTATITNMSQLFSNATSFNQSLNGWNTASVTDMSFLFNGASAFNSSIGNWNTASVVTMERMFYQATAFNQPIGNWNTSAVTNMYQMFASATNFNQPIGSWNTGAVTNMSDMFNNARSFNQPIGNWNTGAVTNMFSMFLNATIFNQSIDNWNTAAVTNMSQMFYQATAFNQPIGNWNTERVTNMSYMFYRATNFNQPIGNWNTGAVTDIAAMLHSATAFNQSIGNWNTERVTNMSYMFYNASAFNQPLGNWNTGAVTNMGYMFYNAPAFNQPIGNWNTGAVTTMYNMFNSAIAFNQPIGNWSTGAVTNMGYMFNAALAFNQNLGTWLLNSNVNLYYMLPGTAMNCANYSATLIGWSKNPLTPSNRTLGVFGRQYNYTGLAARNYLTGTKGWTIGDAGNGATSTLGATTGGVQVCQTVDVSLGRMYTDGCNSLLMITPNGASPVSGIINTCVTIDAALPTYNGQPYLQRHFDITAANNPTTSTARITLYVLQSEFDQFNAGNGVLLDLPANPTNAAGIANLRITQYGGTGNAPGNYPGPTTYINPDDTDVIWNGYHWEISFNVTGFSGFYIHTGFSPLPVTIINFSGYKDGSRNQLQWTTATEINNKGFEVQRSTDGVSYQSIGFVNSLALGGNSGIQLNYRFTDNNINSSNQYYRLRQEDLDGQSKMSQVVAIKGNIATQVMVSGLYPNPAESVVNVVVSVPGRTRLTVLITDMVGRTLLQQQFVAEKGNNNVPLKVESLTPGAYIIQLVGENGLLSAPARFIKK